MPTVSERISRRAHELLAELADHTGWLSAFSSRIEATAQQFRSLGDLAARGSQMVISLDTCELIDVSGRPGRIAPDASELTRRRIFGDIGFSRAAMRTLPGSTLPFTLLPGTVAEIILYLLKHYVSNQQFIEAIKRTEIVEALQALREDVPPELIERIINDENGLDIALDAFEQHLIVTDEFIETVEDVLAHPHFVAPRDLGISKIRFDHDRYKEIYQGIMAARKNYFPLNAIVDAVNLATAGELTAEDDRRVVLHMTRSPSLHLLEKRGVILDMSVLVSNDAETFPIICRPDALWLFNRVIPTMPDKKIPYSVVETIYLGWMSLASHLRQIDRATPDQRRRWVDDPPFEVAEDVFFEEYLRLFIDSATRAEQADQASTNVLDWEAQKEAAHAQDVESDVILQQGRIKNILRLLRVVRGGVEHAMMLSSSSLENDKAEEGPVNFLAEAGLVPVRLETEGMDEFIVYHPASREAVLLGWQLYRSQDGPGCTVYWPTACKRKRFQRAVGEIEKDTVFFGIAGFEDGDIDYLELTGADLNTDKDLFSALGSQAYIQIVQLEGPTRTYTCELLLAGRDANTSVRVRSLPDDAVGAFYELTGGELPSSIVTELITKYWRVFIDGNAS